MLKTLIKTGVSFGHTLNAVIASLKIYCKQALKDRIYRFITSTTVATSTSWCLFESLDCAPHSSHKNIKCAQEEEREWLNVLSLFLYIWIDVSCFWELLQMLKGGVKISIMIHRRLIMTMYHLAKHSVPSFIKKTIWMIFAMCWDVLWFIQKWLSSDISFVRSFVCLFYDFC